MKKRTWLLPVSVILLVALAATAVLVLKPDEPAAAVVTDSPALSNTPNPTTTTTAAPTAEPTDADTLTSTSYLDDIDPDDIIMTETSSMDLIMNIYDSTVRNEYCDSIIIGTVQSIDGAINYNPKENMYTATMTIGQIKVDKVIKGDIAQEVIPFVRLGGTISWAEYEKSLTEAQKAKGGYCTSLTAEEKKQKYTTYIPNEDIVIEAGKTYVMYMQYTSDYGRYEIGFLEAGLREVDTATLPKDKTATKDKTLKDQDKQTIKVKNNKTGKYETLEDVLTE